MEENSKYKFKIDGEVKEVIIREGDAPKIYEPIPLNILGVINAPLEFIKNRVHTLEKDKCNLIIDREQMTIFLNINERDKFRDGITGRLTFNPDFIDFGINGEGRNKSWSTKDLSEHIKMNRSLFTDKETAMKLHTELQNIRVKVEKEQEKSDNNRGDYKMMVAQKVIESNIPASFHLNIPIFKGQPPVMFEVEVYIDPVSYNISLISPDAKDAIFSVRDTIIDEQIASITELFPLAVLEI